MNGPSLCERLKIEVKGQGQMSGSNVKVKGQYLAHYQSTKLPFYLGYISKVNVKVKVKGRGHRSGSKVEIKG